MTKGFEKPQLWSQSNLKESPDTKRKEGKTGVGTGIAAVEVCQGLQPLWAVTAEYYGPVRTSFDYTWGKLLNFGYDR